MKKESSFARHMVAYWVAIATCALVYVAHFIVASWNGAFSKFEKSHSVWTIILEVSVLFLGMGPAGLGARALIAPDQSRNRYSLDQMGNRVHDGTTKSYTPAKEARSLLIFGFGYAITIGVIIFSIGRLQ